MNSKIVAPLIIIIVVISIFIIVGINNRDTIEVQYSDIENIATRYNEENEPTYIVKIKGMSNIKVDDWTFDKIKKNLKSEGGIRLRQRFYSHEYYFYNIIREDDVIDNLEEEVDSLQSENSLSQLNRFK